MNGYALWAPTSGASSSNETMPEPLCVVKETPLESTGIPRYELVSWRDSFDIVAGITGRGGNFELSLASHESEATPNAVWRGFSESLKPQFNAFALAHQLHGTRVIEHSGKARGWLIGNGADGHLTSERGVLLSVAVADCVPVYLIHPDSGAVALLHAGWRGITAGILESGVKMMTDRAGASPAEIIMHCGVSICGDCYEVGTEVLQKLCGQSAPGSRFVDLRAELAARAEHLGLVDITSSDWCTAHHSERFLSHRRSRSADGRMVAYIGRPVA